MNQFNPVIAAHKHSSNNRSQLLASNLCGCFYRLEIYDPIEIEDRVDVDKCAVCPKCGIDSVIGSKSGFPITHEFLDQMRIHWF